MIRTAFAFAVALLGGSLAAAVLVTLVARIPGPEMFVLGSLFGVGWWMVVGWRLWRRLRRLFR